MGTVGITTASSQDAVLTSSLRNLCCDENFTSLQRHSRTRNWGDKRNTNSVNVLFQTFFKRSCREFKSSFPRNAFWPLLLMCIKKSVQRSVQRILVHSELRFSWCLNFAPSRNIAMVFQKFPTLADIPRHHNYFNTKMARKKNFSPSLSTCLQAVNYS